MTSKIPANLPGLPKRALSPQQQVEALRKVQGQAEQRVKLGMQLFKAAEARLGEQRDVLSSIKQHQQELRDHVHEDVAKTLQQYDQWMGKIDENFTRAMQELEGRFEKLESSMADSQQKMQKMMQRAETMLEQTRLLLSQAERKSPTPAPGSSPGSSPSSAASSAPAAAPKTSPSTLSKATAKADTELKKPANTVQKPAVDIPKPKPLAEDDMPPSDVKDKIYSQLLSRLRDSKDDDPGANSTDQAA